MAINMNDSVYPTDIYSEGNRKISHYMGFPQVTPMSSWNYNRSLDNSPITQGLIVNDIDKDGGVKFQQQMPYNRYDIHYFDGYTFKPTGYESYHMPCTQYQNDFRALMDVVLKIEEGNFGVKICRRVVEIYIDDTKETIIRCKEQKKITSLYMAILEFIDRIINP